MNDLLETVIDAHGGLERWNQLDSVSARLIQGGALWALKGQAGVLDDVVVTASLHQERVSHRPFGAADRHSSFTPERVAIESDDGTVREALDQGADGVVAADRLESALGPTVLAVAAGQAVFPRELHTVAWGPLLSRREKQILAMVVMGFTNAEIAGRLFIADSTVKSHLSSAFRKLGVRSRNEATHLILDPEHGLGTGILAISQEDARATSDERAVV